MYKRRLSWILTIMVLLTLLPTWVVPVQAAFENTYTNTGDQRADIIGVALTQVGYREGSNNYTKYGVWFGRPNSAWCGMFVSWCANQAGIPTSVLKRNGIASPHNFGIPYYSSSSHWPQSGDLFFKKDFSHVGLVYYTSGDYFYTIEGNTYESSQDDGVYIRKRKISDFYFGVPSYRGGGEHSYTTGYDTEHPHKEYKFCPHCSDKYYTGVTKALGDCKTCIQEACTHSYGAWSKSSSDRHAQTCSKCDKTVTERHNWTVVQTLKEPSCSESGTVKEVCTVCNAEQTSTVPATESHTYDSAIYIDNARHSRLCTSCKNEYLEEHISDGKWSFDSQTHWRFCSVCGDRIDLFPHNFPNGCQTACEQCGYVGDSTHSTDGTYHSDSTQHWQVCLNCSLPVQTTDHVFLGDCDTTCDACGFKRESSEAHQNILKSDKEVHWIECSICTTMQDIQTHTADESVESWQAQNCTICNFVLRSADDHIHTFQSVSYDSRTHWGTCICGTSLEPEGHLWSMETGNCRICSAVNTVTPEEPSYDWVWLTAAFISILGLGTAIIVMIVKATKKSK